LEKRAGKKVGKKASHEQKIPGAVVAETLRFTAIVIAVPDIVRAP
jgi:hypothetical protein